MFLEDTHCPIKIAGVVALLLFLKAARHDELPTRR